VRTIVLILVATVSCTAADPAFDPSPTPPPAEITGLITDLEYDGEQLTSFVVEARGDSFEILIDPERDYGFNLKHLEQHLTEELPVQVALESKSGGLYAVDILDVPS
jgi:hypothetical protein